MLNRIVFILLTCCLHAEPALGQSTPINGIVNSYTSVSAFGDGCPNSFTVSDASAFNVDDRILLIQMKGADIEENNTDFFGSITNINEAGNYEFGTVSSIEGNDILLVNNLLNDYNVYGLVQLVRVPQYENATVTDVLTCLPWDGSVGGILVMEISNELTLEAPIIADGTGFRGGSVSADPEVSIQCSSTDYFFPDNPSLGGEKGEGIAIVSPEMMTGRGALANGGGGGNDHNSGGGGGANATGGGVGGNEWSGCASVAIGGTGGQPLLFPSRVFLGGGGGGGHQNNGVGTPGTNGGGMIIIRANTLTSNNFPISGNGNEMFILAGNDGAGGGGAGGSILLDVENYTGTLTVTANGSQGGDVNNAFSEDGQCHGNGGGGSGGLIGVTDPVFPAEIISFIQGGAAGQQVNIESDCFGSTYGASPGENGILQTSLVLNESSQAANDLEVDLGPDQVLCQGEPIVLDPALNIVGIWQDGSVQETYTVTEPGVYNVFIEEACGNQSDEILITQGETVDLDLPASYALCPDDVVEIGVANNPNFAYEWSTGETTSLISVAEAGEYTLTATLDDGFCINSAAATTLVEAVDFPELILNGSTSLCEGESAVLTAGGDPGTYLWNTGATGSSLAISSPGIYVVTLTNVEGCSSSDSIGVANLNSPEVSIEGPSSICDSSEVVLTATGNQGDLLWDDGSSETERIITQPGTYSLSVTGGNGCSAEASIDIDLLQLPFVIADDAEFCTTESLRLTAASPNSNLSWPGFSSGSTIIVDEGGTYDVVGENLCGITVRSITITEINCCRAYVPNAFTPDGDGLNDLFAPQISCDPVNYSLRIYNRWGELVFESQSIDEKWNGSSAQDGDHYSGSGLYIYIVNYGDPSEPLEETVTLRGSVMLVR